MQYFIETERLIMRDLLPEDAPGMFAMDSDGEVHRYLGNRPVHRIDQTKANIAAIRVQYVANGIGRWAVIEKSSGDFIGWSGLKLMKEEMNGHIDYYDLGYRFIKRCWGKGYATETALASVQYALNNLNAPPLFGMADAGNAGSRNVLQKAGLQYVENFMYDGTEHAWYKMTWPGK